MDNNNENGAYLKHLYWELGGLDAHQAAALAGRTLRQWGRYLSGQARVPAAVVRLMETRAAGLLGCFGPDWAGWRMYRGRLYSPDGIAFAAGEVRGIPYLYAQIAELERQLRDRAHAADFHNVVPFPRQQLRRMDP